MNRLKFEATKNHLLILKMDEKEVIGKRAV
jgi:hypothetical protein